MALLSQFIRVRTVALQITLVASRHVEREKVSLPGDVCCSKMPFLKFPIIIACVQTSLLPQKNNREKRVGKGWWVGR